MVETSQLKAIPGSIARDSRLDALRGIFLILMVVDHLPSCLRDFTYQSFGYVSAAEGFVFLSGFVVGLTYTRFSLEASDELMWHRACRRARTIYFCHICTFFFLLVVLRAFDATEVWWKTWKPLFECKASITIVMGLTFLSQPRFLDILPMYCVFVLTAPLVIIQLKRGNRLRVIALSCILWVSAQLGAGAFLFSFLPKYLPVNLGDFDIFAWQLLFVFGLYFGFIRYQRCKIEWFRNRVVFRCSLTLAVILFLLRHHFLQYEDLAGSVDNAALKSTLGWIRLLNFAALCLLTSALFGRFENSPAIKMLAYLGRHSLPVFTAHILLVCFVNLILIRENGQGGFNEIIIVFWGVVFLYAVAWFFEQHQLNRTFLRKING